MTAPVYACRECAEPVGGRHREWCPLRDAALERARQRYEAIEELQTVALHRNRHWELPEALMVIARGRAAADGLTGDDLDHPPVHTICHSISVYARRHLPSAAIGLDECRSYGAPLDPTILVTRDGAPVAVVDGGNRNRLRTILKQIREGQ